MSADAAVNFETDNQKTNGDSAQYNAGRKQYSTFNTGGFTLKVILSAVTVYLGIAFGYASFLPYDYSRDRSNFLHTAATSSLQPMMDLAGNGKISHFYDWREIPSAQIADDYFTLTISSSAPQKQDYDSNQSQLLFDAQQSSEAVIVEPSTYMGVWSVVKCTASKPGSQEKICLRSNLVTKGKIRYSIDGESEIWGIDRDNKPINLKTSGYINVNQSRNIPLI